MDTHDETDGRVLLEPLQEKRYGERPDHAVKVLHEESWLDDSAEVRRSAGAMRRNTERNSHPVQTLLCQILAVIFDLLLGQARVLWRMGRIG